MKDLEVAKWAQSNSMNSYKLRWEAESFNARSILPTSAGSEDGERGLEPRNTVAFEV